MKLKYILVSVLTVICSFNLVYSAETANQKLIRATKNPRSRLTEEEALALAKEAIDEGADPNYDNPQYTDGRIVSRNPGEPLLNAVHWSPDMVKFLIKSGAKVNIQGNFSTPLIEALYIINPEKRKNIINLLIELGADVNLQTEYTTPLIQAIGFAQLIQAIGFAQFDIVQTLLQHGADIFQKVPRVDLKEIPNTAFEAARQIENQDTRERILNMLEEYAKKPKPKKKAPLKEESKEEMENTPKSNLKRKQQ